eukprot:12444363-Alexandrium_andersonii.AAC.1
MRNAGGLRAIHPRTTGTRRGRRTTDHARRRSRVQASSARRTACRPRSTLRGRLAAPVREL